MKFWSFSGCQLFRIGFWFEFFLEFWSLIGYAWLVLLWFILELGYAYEILELFWLQVIQDWFLVWFSFRILELDWLCMIDFAVIFFRIWVVGLCVELLLWFVFFIFYFNLASWVMCRNFGPMWCCKYWIVAAIVAVIV